MRRPLYRALPCASVALVMLAFAPALVVAQRAPGTEKSVNMKLVSRIPLGGALPTQPGAGGDVAGLGRRTSDIEIEQELSRPYAYVTRRLTPTGFHIIDLRDPAKAKVLYEWEIEDANLHQGAGALNPMYLKIKDKYYLTVAFQFRQGGPNATLGAIVFDVTGLPDVKKIKEVARIYTPDTPGGFHESFAYKHSSGMPLLITTTTGPHANLYDIEKAIAGDANHGLVGRIPVPVAGTTRTQYHDMYAGYSHADRQDRFYGAGTNGYYVYDFTDVQTPKLITSVAVQGVEYGHTFTPTPDGRYAVVEVEYRHSPLRILELKQAGGDDHVTVNRPIGAWTANWKNFAHNTEVRWPYVFTAAFDDGLQVFNMMDPTNPVTVAYYDTWDGPDGTLATPFNGAWGIDVRNADGLIIVSDHTTGFWAFRMEGFDGWNGKDWGMPNVSSAQDWDNGPITRQAPPRPVT